MQLIKQTKEQAEEKTYSQKLLAKLKRLVRDEMMYGTYSSKSTSRMAEYFLGLVAKARYLVGAPSEVELVLNLSHHFPRNVCSRLSSCPDIKSAYSMLQIEDHHNNNTQRTNWKRTPEGANNAAVASGSGTGGNSRNWRDAGSNNRAVRATTAEADDDAEPETHPIANIFVGPEELLAEDNVDNSCVKVEKSPVIEVLIGERPMLVLLDSAVHSCIEDAKAATTTRAGAQPYA
ncbi:hypothetical protein pipiens_007779 [Culex pipiens pipiens]|uniref:Uncharacterized protein n=1 Tax=Culex pipiens pipiens TaxID=38569 RepID=A0ABD1DJV5_CULPP